MEKVREKEESLKMLDLIEGKEKNNESFTDEELRFLYEIDGYINFDYHKRVQLLLEKRDRKKDLARIFNCNEDMISLDSNNVLENQIYYDGYTFICNLKEVDKISIPRTASVLYINGLTSARDLILPKGVSRVYLNGLTSVKDLVLPEGDYTISLEGLEDIGDFEFPEEYTFVSFIDLSKKVNIIGLNSIFTLEQLSFIGEGPYSYISWNGSCVSCKKLKSFFDIKDDSDLMFLRNLLIYIECRNNKKISKSLSDFCMLHDIIILQKNDGTLSDEGLRFLYEMDSSIYKNSKIMNTMYERIITKRNRKEDLAYLFNCSEDMISIDKDNVLGNQIYYDGYTFVHNGNNGIIIPKATKELYLNGVEDIKGIVIPEGVLDVWYKEKKYSREEFLDLQKKGIYGYKFNPNDVKEQPEELGGVAVGSKPEDVAVKTLKQNGFISNTIILTNIILFGILSFIITLLILK